MKPHPVLIVLIIPAQTPFKTSHRRLIGYGTPSGVFTAFKKSQMIVRIDKVKGMLYEMNTKKRTSWRWREATQMDPKEIEITKHLKLRISLNRLSSTRVRPSYTLFFSDGDESFHIHMANTTNQDRAVLFEI